MKERRKARGTWTLFALLIAVAGCGEDPLSFGCTTEFVYGLHLTVLDGAGAPAAQGALGLAVDGSFVDTLEVRDDRLMLGAGERAGAYDITVSKTGFMTWTATNVTVVSNVCHVIPVHLEVNLIPAP